jgi:hypothetical protein
MSTIQDLLNKEAKLANSGHDKTSPERKEIHIVIRKLRDKLYMPLCFGQDDCSTQLLSTCPWRFDCGE